VVTWELPNALMTEGDFAGKPFTRGQVVHGQHRREGEPPKGPRQLARPGVHRGGAQGFDVKKLLGVPCMLSLTPNDKGKVRVTGIMKPPQGTHLPAADQSEPSISRSSATSSSQATFDWLSEFWQKEIKKSPEWADLQGKPGPVKHSAGSSLTSKWKTTFRSDHGAILHSDARTSSARGPQRALPSRCAGTSRSG
jgi:hypothetical protein